MYKIHIIHLFHLKFCVSYIQLHIATSSPIDGYTSIRIVQVKLQTHNYIAGYIGDINNKILHALRSMNYEECCSNNNASLKVCH